MRPWTRLQDWVTLLAGAYTITSPIVLSTIGMAGEAKVVVAMITLGALVAISSLVSLARPAVSAGGGPPPGSGCCCSSPPGWSATPASPAPRGLPGWWASWWSWSARPCCARSTGVRGA